MNVATRVEVGCPLVAEFTDAADVPTGALGRGEPVRPTSATAFHDAGSSADAFKEFTVLLKDGRVVAVRGVGVKPLSGALGVLAGAAGDALVAVFQSAEVVGIFHGELRAERKSA
jgi:hypothetical protein